MVASLDSNGALTVEQRQLLADCVAGLRQRHRKPDLHADDPMAYFRARDLLTVARLTETASAATLTVVRF